MDITTQLELCLDEQMQIVTSVDWRGGSQQFFSWIATVASWLLVSLLF